MGQYRSSIFFNDRKMAGARSLWRATGMGEDDFEKPIVAIVNSYTQFVPGHVHLKEVGDIVAAEVWAAGGVPREFNTIAVDDGIAMGHEGMLYSLPSREVIADSIEYMINGHQVDAMVCISNCDKITPGMLMAAMRLNIPAVFVSGGPMEAGKTVLPSGEKSTDLIDAIFAGANPQMSDEEVAAVESSACPTCGSCSGMFTANSMNCLAEALGLALPGNGSLLATHEKRRSLFIEAGRVIVDLARRWYEQDDGSALPRGIATFEAFENAMTLDIAMGGSTNTVLHLLAMAQEGEVDFTMSDIDRLSRKTPHLCKVAPATPDYHMEDVHRAGGIVGILGELLRAGLLHDDLPTVHSPSVSAFVERWDIACTKNVKALELFKAAPGGLRTTAPFSQGNQFPDLDRDRRQGCIRDIQHAYRKDGGLAVLSGNLAADGCIVKSAGVAEDMLQFTGPAKVYESQDAVSAAILSGEIVDGVVIVVRYEGPKGGPGMQEMLYPSTFLKSVGLNETCALITDGRFSGGSSGLSVGHISPEAAEGGTIALVEDGDAIHIDIPNREISLMVDEAVLEARRAGREGPWQPLDRDRPVSKALQLYAKSVSSAAKGAVRDLQFL